MKQQIFGTPFHLTKAVRPLALLATLLVLSGCANQQQAQSDAPEQVADTTTAEIGSGPTSAAAAPLDGKSFFNIFAAEMALAVGNTELALRLYLTQLEEQPDVGVAKRVVSLADSMGAFPNMANAAEIWLEAEPNNPLVHLALATSLYQMHHFDLVDTPLLRLIALNPDFPVETIFDPVMPEGGDPLALEALFNRLLIAEPKAAGFHLGYGQWLHQQARYDEAKQALQASIKYQNSVSAQVLLGRTEMRLSDAESAAKVVKKALKAFPNNRRLVVQYARYASMAHQAEKAMDVLESYHRLQPDDHPLLSLYARVAIEVEAYETARRLYENLLTFQPAVNEALFFLGSIALDEGRLESAMSYFRQVTPSDYFEPALSALISTVTNENGVESAIDELQAAKNRFPDQLSIYREHARLLSIVSDFSGALTVLNEGLAIDENNNALLYARAITYAGLNNTPASIVDLERIIEQDPDHVLALNALGYTLADANQDLSRAWDLIQRAYAIDPNDPAIVDSLGWIHYRRGELQEAEHFLAWAFNETKNHEIAAHLGEVLWVTGRREAAEAVWLEGLEQSPGSDIILDTRARLLGLQ